MKRTLIRIAAAVLMLAGLAACSFSFMQDTDLTGCEDTLRCVVSDYSTGKLYSYYDIETDAFRFAELFFYDGNGNTTRSYHYDDAKALVWYQAFAYLGDLVETAVEYDASGTIQWARRYAYGTAGFELDKVTASASFDAALAATGSSTFTNYVAEGPGLQSIYGSDPGASGAFLASRAASRDARRDASLPRAKAAPRAAGAYAVPTPPATVVPSIPTGAALTALGLSGYTYWNYSGLDKTEISFDEGWYPQRVYVVDGRINKPLTVELGWSAGRIASKKTYYGSTLALDLELSYDASGYPSVVKTSGASLLLPLEYRIKYEGAVPSVVEVSNNGHLLQSFSYVYDGIDLDAGLLVARSADPFALLDQLAKANLQIIQRDGDGKTVETFVFSADGSDFRIEVRDPKNSLNGYYQASYDGSGNVASLAAYNAAGSQQWIYSYSYGDLVSASEAAGVDFGRLADTYVTDDMGEYARAFVMDLLF